LPKRKLHILVLSASLLYIIINSLLIARENYLLLIVPFILAGLYLLVFKLDVYFLLLVLLTPLSIQLKIFFPEIEADLFLPTEPMVFGAMLLFFARLVSGMDYEHKFFLHPVSLLILFSLGWMLITSMTSTMPLVSFKYFLVRMWFVTVFFFLAVYMFRDFKMVKRFLWLYVIPLTVVIIYTLLNQSGFGFFEQRLANMMSRPFFNDHTSFGSAVAMFIPVLIALLSIENISGWKKVVTSVLLILFIAAALLSYSRATWLSLIIAGLIWVVILLKIRLRTLVIFALFTTMFVWLVKDEVIYRLEKTSQESSSDFGEHLRSIPNITSDASNLERINRWKTGWEMFKEKPMMGWGPGTYMFQYAPFQKSYDRTIISTNFGDWGNVHSEYLGPLIDSGLPGGISFLLIVFWAFYTGVKVYRQSDNKKVRRIALGVLTGLTTYFIHGTLNNFLDTDKAAVPFWGFIAILVAFDMKYLKENSSSHAEEKSIVSGDEKSHSEAVI
jgi:putative inorganic carbon (hco3(-)) transporter